jgi:hypothetical protein
VGKDIHVGLGKEILALLQVTATSIYFGVPKGIASPIGRRWSKESGVTTSIL